MKYEKHKRKHIGVVKAKLPVTSFVHCSKCDDEIPVRRNMNSVNVLNGHIAYCTGYQVHRTRSSTGSIQNDYCQMDESSQEIDQSCQQIDQSSQPSGHRRRRSHAVLESFFIKHESIPVIKCYFHLTQQSKTCLSGVYV